MGQANELRKVLSRPGMLVAPGVYDCVGARLVQEEGFQAVYMTGNGTVASKMGRPDIGIASMNQMVDWARSIVQCVDIPLISDADNGYGDLNNVKETVRSFEAAGVAAIHIEDQVFPKRCGAMAGVRVVDAEEAADRIKIACKTRKDMLIIARSDCLAANHGVQEMIRRLNMFADAGADIVFPEMVQDMDQLKQIVKSVNAPVMFDILEFGTFVPTIEQLENAGVKIAFNCLSLMFLNCNCMKEALEIFKQNGDWKTQKGKMMDLHVYENLMGLSEANQIRNLLI